MDNGWLYRAYRDRVVREDVIVREMLGRWVSELEPVIVRDHRHDIVGLTHADQPVGGYPRISVVAAAT